MTLSLRRLTPWLLPCLLALCWCLPNSSKGDDTGAYDWVPPSDWTAAARINSYLGAYLDNGILASLDSPAPTPRRALGTMSVDFAAHRMAAATPTEQALYTNAANLCDLVARILDEREAEQINLVNLNASGNAVNPLDRPAYAVSGHYSWNLERERARGQRRQEVQGRLANIDRRNSFVTFSLKHWSDQVVQFRQSIQTAAINVSAAQIRYDREIASAKAVPPSPAVALAAATATISAKTPPAPPAPPANSNGADPISGNWWVQGATLMLGSGHDISGSRSGSWAYTCTTNGGRNYELYWSQKSLVDYLVLSEDGKTLCGKSQNHLIYYYRL